MNIPRTFAAMMAAGAATVASAVDVSDVTMAQNLQNRLVTITYRLSGPAVVTLDIQTNATPNAATGWKSIGGEHICNARGAVWRKVTDADANDGVCAITWQPVDSWLDGSGDGFKVGSGRAKAVITAWPLDNTPDYMVVDIAEGAQPNTQRYYPAVDFLPGAELGQKGAVTNNTAYKTSMLVMRKIMAKDVTWTMGSTSAESLRSSNETTHQVTLTNNYYIGIFEVTQKQWAYILPGSRPSYFTAEWEMRPVERVSFNKIRMASNSNTAAADALEWPAPPYSGSWLDRLRTRTGLDFDLPSEAQWEFACRAGHGDGKWGNGSAVLNTQKDANLNKLARTMFNGGFRTESVWREPLRTDAPTNGTAIVGTYLPNSWGLYDMHGNVCEAVLDKYLADITSLNGAVNTEGSGNHVVRGGRAYDSGWTAGSFCRSAYRTSQDDADVEYHFRLHGLRVACRAGLK